MECLKWDLQDTIILDYPEKSEVAKVLEQHPIRMEVFLNDKRLFRNEPPGKIIDVRSMTVDGINLRYVITSPWEPVFPVNRVPLQVRSCSSSWTGPVVPRLCTASLPTVCGTRSGPAGSRRRPGCPPVACSPPISRSLDASSSTRTANSSPRASCRANKVLAQRLPPSTQLPEWRNHRGRTVARST